eukprot:CAMPEP_0178953806 /NCGR_PEP_ID=MMETSP0789-20121207/8628_1 /TAXON_ID=3005 /ORGANISM="Rhizosolenia setigera, Strain CCMP 1694" /LENGTH=474 /DNA_ID=CAMNT_0020635115 /DNA_START=129 /DNA_END=1553 /DNA_ORIENTATION=-
MKYRTYAFYLFGSIAAIAKGNPEEGDQVVLAQQVLPSSTSTIRLNDVEKKEQETRENDNPNRFLEVATMGLFEVVTKVLQDDDCCDENSTDGDGNDEEYSDVPSQSPNPGPAVIDPTSPTAPSPTAPSPTGNSSPSPTGNPSSSPTYSEKELVASDIENEFQFGYSCSFIDNTICVTATRATVDGVEAAGAAYIFNPGEEAEVSKMTVSGASSYVEMGSSVSIDEKIVVGVSPMSVVNFFHIFSREGVLERTVTCIECGYSGKHVATRGNKIVASGNKGVSGDTLFIYNTQGVELKTFDLASDNIQSVAISDEVIVAGFYTKTRVYSNLEPDFPLLFEIPQGGYSVATLGDKIVVGDANSNAAWLYDTTGALVKTLDSPGVTGDAQFGFSVAITDEKVVVGAVYDEADDGTVNTGSVYIYSANDGELIEKIRSPDSQESGYFGQSVCAFGSYFVVGSMGESDFTGAAYLFRFSS